MGGPSDERFQLSTYSMTDEQGGVVVDDLGPAKKRTRSAARGDAATSAAGESSDRGAQAVDSPPRSEATALPATAAQDPRAAEIERLVQRGDWRTLEKLLHGESGVLELPPAWQVLWAIAAKESGATRPGLSADAMAIVGVAALLGVPRDSASAMVLGKRLIRRRTMSQRPAPRPVISWLIVIVGLALGAALGFVLSQ